MTGQRGRPDEDQPDAPDRAPGPTDTDDTTEADAGMVGGTGATPGAATVQPLGTEPPADEQAEEDREE